MMVLEDLHILDLEGLAMMVQVVPALMDQEEVLIVQEYVHLTK